MLSMYGGEARYKIKYVYVNFDLKMHTEIKMEGNVPLYCGCWNSLSNICILY